MKFISVCFCALLIIKLSRGLDDALVTEKVFLDLEVEGSPAGRVVIGLFGATAPKTVRNFVALANHEVCEYIYCFPMIGLLFWLLIERVWVQRFTLS